MSANKSVRFAAGAGADAKVSSAKRLRDDDEEDRKPAAVEKQAKRSRPNEDEFDDIDDWRKEDDGEEEEGGQSLPSQRELLEAKRKRRQLRGEGVNADGGTHIDDVTSLATEGIAIEPFHMKSEETDGTGYFDGDTYVFRKNNPNEEADAWLDGLNEDNGNNKQPSNLPNLKKEKKEPDNSLDDLTTEQLYSKILPLLGDNETVANAVRRYGHLVKQKRGAKAGPNIFSEACLDNLNELSGAANALLLKGEVDIYDTTRQHILKALEQKPQKQDPPSTEKQPSAQWEYMGNQDAQIHGPYTTEQMIGWTQAGYFVSDQKVKIRNIREEQLSTKEDLLADLMDDDDEEDVGVHTKTVKGEWMWSNEIDFRSYLS